MKVLIIILIIVIVLAGVVLMTMVRHGLSSREQPTLMEEGIARAVRHLATPLSMRHARNPVPLTNDVLAEARAHWADHCATCHANSGLRIRLQGLPYLAEKKEASKVIGEWPAYRVSTTHVMTMQHRLYDCYWQMRMPELQLGSEASVALIAFLTKQAEGGEIAAPGLKR